MTYQEKFDRLVEAAARAHKYLADMAANGGPSPGLKGINEWCEVQGGLFEALRTIPSRPANTSEEPREPGALHPNAARRLHEKLLSESEMYRVAASSNLVGLMAHMQLKELERERGR